MVDLGQPRTRPTGEFYICAAHRELEVGGDNISALAGKPRSYARSVPVASEFHSPEPKNDDVPSPIKEGPALGGSKKREKRPPF